MSNLLMITVIVLGWLALQLWILPYFGVAT